MAPLYRRLAIVAVLLFGFLVAGQILRQQVEQLRVVHFAQDVELWLASPARRALVAALLTAFVAGVKIGRSPARVRMSGWKKI